jgi:transcriptional regulator with XRE-family HTH domain
MRDITAHFGLALRQLRDARGWSQEALAQRANLNRTYVGDLERNLATPSLLTLEKLAHALGCPTSALLVQVEQVAHLRRARHSQLMAIAG